jgi:hypothetical protein
MDIETPKPSNGAASESFLRTAVNSVSESSSPGGKHQASDPIVLMSFHRSTISGVANGRRPSLCHSACNIDPLSRGIGVQN